MKRAAENAAENYFSGDEDEAWEHTMVRSLDRSEQLGGALGPLFHFRMQPVGRRRRWRDVVDHTQFHAVLEQAREARRGDNLGVHLMEALYRAIRGQIAADANPHDLLHFAIHAHGFTHAFRSTNIQVEDFMNRGRYLDELLDTLAGKLNSNEEFHPDRGLQIDVVLVRMPTPGSRPRKWNVGQRTMDKDSKRKKCIIEIKNRDELCCARAIVTMRAWCHRNDPGCMPWNEWRTLRDGFPRQTVRARELHQAAGVPEGPCGLRELDLFQHYLSTLDPPYQLKVLSRQHPFFLFSADRTPLIPSCCSRASSTMRGAPLLPVLPTEAIGVPNVTAVLTPTMRPTIPARVPPAEPVIATSLNPAPTTTSLRSHLHPVPSATSIFTDPTVWPSIDHPNVAASS